MRRFPYSLYSNPKGGRLKALERNILKYRSLQMMLVLCYAEAIRSFILGAIYPVAARRKPLSEGNFERERLLLNKLHRSLSDAVEKGTLTYVESEAIQRLSDDRRPQGKRVRIALADLVANGLLSQEESKELQRLIDYRNDIAHRVYYLTADLSPEQWTEDILQVTGTRYNYVALDRLTHYRNQLWTRCSGRYVMSLSIGETLSLPVQKAYKEELKRLDRIIIRQLATRKREIREINAELSLEGTGLVDDLHPRFPTNRTPNGKLTRRGVEICYRLFDLGKTPLAVAYIMGMTYKSALNRFKGWQNAGGRDWRRAEVKRYDPAGTPRSCR